MNEQLDHANDTTRAWRELAMNLPEVVEGSTCVKASYKAGKKAFLYVGAKPDSYNAMVKLADSLPEAEALSEGDPEKYKVGKFGWVTMNFPADEEPPVGLLERWIVESYRLLVPKSIAKQLSSA